MDFRTFFHTSNVILDGGSGTMLQAAGLLPGESPERWNLTHSADVVALHKAYYDAGSNVVCTNTFGANCLHFTDEELAQIIPAAVENTRQAARESASTQPKFTALDIGPLGKLLKPYGDYDFEDAVAAFAQVVRLGVACGVDLIFIETMNDSYETKAALLAAKENSDVPVFVSNAYSENGALMTGASPEAMVAMLEGLGADAIGMNCSLGPRALWSVAERYLAAASVPILFKPNAGLPKVVDGKTVFDVGAEEFADDVARMIQAGVRIAGGCCGTTPAYIAALVKQCAALPCVPVDPKQTTVISSYTHTVTFGETPVLIGERINPTGKKRFKQALVENDIGYILQEGIRQQDKGVHVLDVNVGLPDIDEVTMLRTAVCELQAVIDLPLQIDTSDAVAMEQALRRYNGKALVNSVNGKQESMDAVFPLVKKYGGVVVALTLDERGIPETAAERVAIARHIIDEAARYGIAKKDLIFDTLAMTISADQQAANATLESLDIIAHELGCKTSLGVSNISFGLPVRDYINGTFFTMALTRGLSAAIMNPFSVEMMKAYHAFLALSGNDANCAEYIAFATENTPAVAAAPAATAGGPSATDTAEAVSALRHYIQKGLREQAADETATVLKAGRAPLDVVNEEIIPALDMVGKGFEAKTVYLPQLLMSAEAAKCAFEKIKQAIQKEGHSAGDNGRPVCILATVKGDIHDIGKNIVRLLLENYGFPVIDLGKDVPPEAIVEATLANHAPIVGLSALMTTTVPSMEATIRLLRDAAPFCKVVVGGAVLTQEYADKIGADKYARDAMDTVRYALDVQEKLSAQGRQNG